MVVTIPGFTVLVIFLDTATVSNDKRLNMLFDTYLYDRSRVCVRTVFDVPLRFGSRRVASRDKESSRLALLLELVLILFESTTRIQH
jgi:hypothetical protein